MSQWIGAIILVAGFVFLFQLLGLVNKSRGVVRVANQSLNIIRSPQLSDEEKEVKLQKNSQKLFGSFFTLALGGAFAVLIPLGVLWFGDRFGWLSLAFTLDTTFSPAFLIFSSVLVFVVLGIKPRKQHPNSETQASSYSNLDRTLHQLAFNTYTAQIAIADVEDTMFSKQLANCQTERPVFITALPRAGTTLLLECCADLPEFASHCYRDMPFVLIPCLWNRFAQSFQQTVESTERAHGDGMKISPDSYEALEEVVWKTFWKRHYQKDRIIPWDNEENLEFNEFFDSHLRKIILLRRGNSAPSVRYVSKNNANIARTRILKRLFPDSVIIIPFRHPLHHASSLLQQHLNFLQIHEADSFASDYMKAIGHYDFGQNLRPIDFDGWFDRRESRDARSLAFWLEYWVASYKYLLQENADFLNFLDYEALCENPIGGLRSLAEVVESCDPDALVSSASGIRQPRPREIGTNALSASLLKDANLIYDRLREISLN
ncbi:Sulfotransferase family protein (modular protein) [Hyella patelloides LEGE 07179]|uniref:Sulfotransferase family protein (Modular protein) n=1 Tax=Hyella patelloides LEGE 07179 TaxID=945734 RepID=A0A563VUJ2_9CYAN|nr:sulfotransferase [Hyella patelloides]VEP15142.1 Sulfotransferase family protein (modular protein) [Hyella patelloides LEGE 07179]